MNRLDWLDNATANIYFRPDRRAVRRELEAHLEDLREVSGLEEEAAVEAMGDPAAIAEELGWLHRPWWGVQTSYRTSRLNVWPRNPDGATLVALPSYLQSRPTMIVGLAAVEPPARAVRAKLTLDMTAHGQGTVYTAEGEREGAIFLFRLEEPPEREQVLIELLNATELPPYTLEFFDADGALLETVTNIEGG